MSNVVLDRDQYTKELYNTLMDPEFENKCMTTVIICGPPPPTPRRLPATDGPNMLGIDGLKVREAWCEEVSQLCMDRFNITYGNIGDFITVLDIWWSNEQKEADHVSCLGN